MDGVKYDTKEELVDAIKQKIENGEKVSDVKITGTKINNTNDQDVYQLLNNAYGTQITESNEGEKPKTEEKVDDTKTQISVVTTKETTSAADWKRKNNKKRITSKQRQQLNNIYRNIGKELITVGGEKNITTFEEGQINAEKLFAKIEEITDKKPTVVYEKTKQDLIAKLEKLEEDGSITTEQREEIERGLEDGSMSGAIIGNQFLTIDPDAKEKMRGALGLEEQSNFIQSMVWVHEAGHYLDNSTKTRAELNKKAELLNKFLLKHGNLTQVLNEDALMELRMTGYIKNQETIEGLVKELETAEGERINEINTALDEYIRKVEERLSHEKNDYIYNKLLNEGRGLVSKIFNPNYEVNNARDAIYEVVSYIEAIRRGDLSVAYETRLKAVEGKPDLVLVADEVSIQKSEVEARENLKIVQDAAKYNPNSPIITKELPGMIDAQIYNYFITRPSLKVSNDSKQELKAEIMFRLRNPSRTGRTDINGFDGRGTLYGYLNGRIRWRMLDAFEQNPTIVPDYNQKEIDDARAKLLKELDETTDLDQVLEDDNITKINVLQIGKISNKQNKIIDVVNEKGNFRDVIDNNKGKVGGIIFGIPENKIENPQDNITIKDKIIHVRDWSWVDKNGKINKEKSAKAGDEITKAQQKHDPDLKGIIKPSEAKAIQDFFADINVVKDFIKIQNETNVTEKSADINKLGENIEVSRDTYGRAVGLPDLILEYFYEPKFKPNGKRQRSQGLTSQVPMWELKPEFENFNEKQLTKLAKKFQDDIGVGQDETTRAQGQLLKGAAVVISIRASLSAAKRIKEGKIKAAEKAKDKARVERLKQEAADILAAQPKVAFSKRLKSILDVRSIFTLETKGIDELIESYKQKGTFDLKTTDGREDFIEGIKKDLLPMFPKEFFFKYKNGKVTSSIFTYSHNNYGSFSMSTTDGKAKSSSNEYINPKEATLYNEFRNEIFVLGEEGANVKFGKDIKGANWNLTKGYSTIFGNKDNYTEKLKNTEAIKEWNANIALIHKEMWRRFNKTIRLDKTGKMAGLIGSYLKLTANDKQSWHRLGAQYAGHSLSLTNREGKTITPNIEFEHAMPATAAYLYLIDAALSDTNFEMAYDLVIDNYKLIVLDKAMDDKLRNARTKKGYSLMKRMPDDWSIIDNKWWQRYFNDIVALQDGGIDPSSIVGLDGKTFAQTFNINAEGKPRPVKTGVNSKIQQSKAINSSRAININTPSVGMSAWDFDDTLATTKSGVMATVPNPDGTPQPGRKVIFLAGGAGSGKGNVISKLGLENQGFKVVNQDISLEWLKKNSGLPADMNDLTKEQRSKLGSLQHQARGIARRKMMKYQGNADGVVVDGTG